MFDFSTSDNSLEPSAEMGSEEDSDTNGELEDETEEDETEEGEEVTFTFRS